MGQRDAQQAHAPAGVLVQTDRTGAHEHQGEGADRLGNHGLAAFIHNESPVVRGSGAP
jgi:hypothetical protein